MYLCIHIYLSIFIYIYVYIQEPEFRKPVEPIIPVKVAEPLPVKSVSFLPVLRDMVASGNQPDDQTVMLLMNAYQRVNDKEGICDVYIYIYIYTHTYIYIYTCMFQCKL
jgi:hypothetical protein